MWLLFGIAIGWFVGHISGYQRAVSNIREHMLTRQV